VAVLAVLWRFEKRSRKKWIFFVCVTVWYTITHCARMAVAGWQCLVSLERGDDGGSNGAI
jgi:hypothetical protein